MDKQKKNSKNSEEEHLKKESRKSKRGQKTAGSRWIAVILLAITIILSLIFKLQSNFSGLNQSQSSQSTGKTWQFTVKDSN